MAAFLRMVGGDDGADALERCVPGALDEATAHAEGFFGVELPAIVRWTFGPDDAARIGFPVLNLLGAEELATFRPGEPRSSSRGSRAPAGWSYPT